MKRNKNNFKKYTRASVRAHLPTRGLKDNKTRGGKCLVIAGSRGMYGAAVLCATAAARVGAGYTYVYTNGKFPSVRHPDFLVTSDLSSFSQFQAIAVGPGFKNHGKIKSLLQKLIRVGFQNVVLDAEALKVIANIEIKLPSTWIATPHEGELSRILGVSSVSIRADRKKYARQAQKKLGCIVLLKGNRTLVASSNDLWEIQSGNPALSKAGTGDVLTGIILGLLSQGLDPLISALSGAFIHGHIADQWLADQKDQLSLMASDVVSAVPQALFQLRKR